MQGSTFQGPMQASTSQGKGGMANAGLYVVVKVRHGQYRVYVPGKGRHGECREIPSGKSRHSKCRVVPSREREAGQMQGSTFQ